jgi:hypothetical protein
MNNGDYGYHAGLYSNLVTLIEGLDVSKVRAALKMTPH